MKRTAVFIFLMIVLYSCKTASRIFHKETPHEQYESSLDRSGLEQTPLGRQWLAAAQSALDDPQPILAPYRQTGFFPIDKPRALGLKFSARQGEKLIITLARNAPANFVLYADLYLVKDNELTQVHAADTTADEFSIDATETGDYLLRIQPELFRTGTYSLSISLGPSLFFPVSGNKSKMNSFWGASRDGGKRRHEGIDIFAPKRTPVVAAADGVITAVKQEGIGGKTVWLRPAGQNVTLYYAHLDKQLVQQGQQVKKGQVLGLVGNTGNARTTPSHLHFGVYCDAGPVDPFPFINPTVRAAPPPPQKDLKVLLRLKTKSSSIQDNMQLIPLAINGEGYIAEQPDGKLIQAGFASTQIIPEQKQNLPVKKSVKNKIAVVGVRNKTI
jgi:murein DD-endopeptidase MepM/ murein hydrolase activator NlpD